MNAARAAIAAELIAEAVHTSGSVRFRVLGSSMRPWIRNGDLVHVQRADLRDMRKGQVAVFQRAGAIFVHRVIRQTHRNGQLTLITKGDAFPDADAPVNAGELLGRVAAVERGTRRMVLERMHHRALGKGVAFVSAGAPLWYPHLRTMRRVLRAALG